MSQPNEIVELASGHRLFIVEENGHLIRMEKREFIRIVEGIVVVEFECTGELNLDTIK